MSRMENNIDEILEHMARSQEENSSRLARLENRIALIHDEVRRSAETVTRLKLMADNAKKLAASQREAVDAILTLLDRERSA